MFTNIIRIWDKNDLKQKHSLLGVPKNGIQDKPFRNYTLEFELKAVMALTLNQS